MLTTKQAFDVIQFLAESTLQAMQSAAFVSKTHGKNIDADYESAKSQMEVFIHNALHVNNLQPDPKDALPPEEDKGGDVAVNDPAPKSPTPKVTA